MPPDGLDKYLDQLAGKTTKKRPTGDDSVARVLDDEFSKLGYGDTARLSILGDVGRENNWNRNIIFGGHVDPASYTKGRGKIENRGIISWNGDRRTKLDNHLKNEGVLGRGDDDELRGMARFMDKELRESFPNVYKKLKGAKGTYEASEALRQYIKYVPDAPYNSPDPEFRVKNNADWAKRARSLGLGQKGLDNYLDGLAGKTTSPTFPTNQPLQTPPTSTGPAAQGRMAIGDSIAAGLIWHGGIEGKANKVLRDFSNGATASGGAPPSQVLKTIQAMPDGSVRGKQIILSTGASNGPAGLDAVQAQIDALRQKGAAGITILGVGPHKNYVGVNDRLEKIAKANGVTFGGALQTGDDGVHPNNYRKLARSLLTAADTRLDSYLDGLAGKTTSPTFAGTQPLTTPPPIDDDIIRVDTAIDQQGNMLADPLAVDSPFKAVEQARALKNGVAPVAPVPNEIQPPVADKTPLGKLQKRIAPLAPVQQQGAPQVAQQPADPRQRTATAPPLTRQQLIDTQPVPQPLPNQDYQRSGILKTGNGSALKYVQNDPTFGVAPPEGFERFADDNGQTYLLDQNGKLQDESLAQVAFQATVSLARPSVPLPDAKNAYIMQVADQLGEQYDLNKNDVYAYLEQQGVVDLGTKAPKEEQGFYARPGGGMETLNQASMQAAGLPPIGNQGDTDTFSMSARDLNNLFTYVGQKKEGSTARARDLISKGLLDPNDVQQIQEMGLNPEEFAAYSPETAGRVDPRVYQATKVGQETRRNTERIRNSYLQQGMDPRKAYFAALGDQKILSAKEVDAETKAIDELRAESAKNNGWLGGLEGAAQVMGQGLLQSSQLGLGSQLGGNEVSRDPMIGTPERIAALRQKWIEHGLDAQLAKYGSYTKAKSALDSAKAEEAARQARIAKADWLTATAGRSEAFLRGTVKAIMQTPGTVMQGAAVWTKPVADYIDSVFGTQSSSIKQNGVYQFGKWLNSLAPGASARSDYDEEWVGGILGQGIGSSVGMIPMAMGGPIPLMAWSTLQMTGGDFESALAEGVKESDAAQYSRITGGLLGWTERLGIGGGWLRALEGNPATRGFVRKLVTEIARESAEEIFLNEGPQNLGQNLIAKLTIDPNRPWDKGVLDAMATAGISASIMSVIMTSLLHVKHKGQINAALKQAVLNGGPNMVDFGDETGVYIHGKPAEITPEMQPLLEKHRLLSKQMQQGFVDIDEFRKYWQAARQAAAPIAHGAYTELPAGTVENLGEQRWRQHLEDAQREQFRLFQEQQTVAGQLVEASGIPAPTILEQKETAEAAKAEASGDTIIPPGASAADIAAQKYPTAPVVEPSGSETPESETQPDLSPTGETQMPPVITDEMAQQIAEAGNLPAAEQQTAINNILAQNGNAEPIGETAANIIPATTAVPTSQNNNEAAPKARPPITLQGIRLSAKGQTAASKFLADTDVQNLLPTLGTDQEPQALDGLKKAAANYGLTPSATIAILDRQRTENLKPEAAGLVGDDLFSNKETQQTPAVEPKVEAETGLLANDLTSKSENYVKNLTKFIAKYDRWLDLVRKGEAQTDPQLMLAVKRSGQLNALTTAEVIRVLQEQRDRYQGKLDAASNDEQKSEPTGPAVDLKEGDAVTNGIHEGTIKKIIPDAKYGDYAIVDTPGGEKQFSLDKLKPVSSGSPAIDEIAAASLTELATNAVAPLGLPEGLAERVTNRLTADAERDGTPVGEASPETVRKVIVSDLDGYRRNDLRDVLRPFIERVKADDFDVIKDGGKVWGDAQEAIKASDERHENKKAALNTEQNSEPAKPDFAGTVNMDAVTPENIDQIKAITDKIGQPEKAAKPTADLFDDALSDLYEEDKPAKAKDEYDDIADIMGFEPSMKSVLAKTGNETDDAKQEALTPVFQKALDKFTDTADPAEKMKSFLRTLKDRFTLDQIAQLKPYIVRFMDENAAATAAKTRPMVELAKAFAKELGDGKRSFKTIIEARKFAAEILGQKIEAGTELAKQVDEAIEVGVVMTARNIINARRLGNFQSDQDVFDRLVHLYDQQPSLNVRTSTSVRDQAYSTPAPLAFIASRLAGIDFETSIYEPTAGNGMLLTEAPNSVRTLANELNPERFASLKEVMPDALTTNKNALDQNLKPESRDIIIGNPPFGVVKDEDGLTIAYQVNDKYKTNEIDHAIVFKALEAMKPEGKAVFIIGGVRAETDEAKSDKYNGAAKRKFYFSLFQEYNVIDHFTVDGSLYSKQGANYPVDVLVINGKGKSELKLPAASLPRVYDSWDGLKELLSDEPRTSRNQVEEGQPGSVDARSGEGPNGRSGSNATRTGSNAADLSDVSSRPGEVDAERGTRTTDGTRESDRTAQTEQSVGTRDFSDAADIGGRDVSVEPGSASETVETRSDSEPAAANAQDEQAGREDNTGLGLGELDNSTPRVRKDRKALDSQSASDTGQVPYEPQSNGQAMDTLVPTNLYTAVINSLETLESKVGPVDDYVAQKLGYKNAKDVHGYFAGEQIDALALALYNMENGAGFIIGDQTGIGKGRVVAGVLRYAMQHGLNPIFVTEKPNLYKDMIRDLNDIGVMDVRPLITNSGESVPLDDDQTQFLTTPASTKHNTALRNMTLQGELADDYNLIFTTYNQMQAVKQNETPRREFLREMSNRGIIVFDESHNAGGDGAENKIKKKVITAQGMAAARVGDEQGVKDHMFDRDASNRAEFARELVGKANGVFYSSATYAKRPEVMSLYSKTDMRHAVDKESSLADAINAGGVPLQQVVATMLAESGQYIRRERDFTGINYDTVPIPVNKELAEKVSSVMLAVKEFDDVKQEAVKKEKKALKEEAATVMADSAVGNTGISSTNFTSIMHNLIDQMLLTLKLDGAIDNAVKSLESGEKVILTLSNTMGSFIDDFAHENNLAPGDAIGVHFGDMLRKYLERSRDIQIGKPFETKITRRLSDDELGPQGVSAYNKALEMIQGKPVNYKDENGDVQTQYEDAPDWASMPASPIDYLKFKLETAGYKVGEITGRQHVINYNAAGDPTYRMRPAAEVSTAGKTKTINAFNGGSVDNPVPKDNVLDVVILNRAGSTGLSLHASEKFADQRKRKMFIIQAEKNIDTHMQMLGRSNRTGQVNKPGYGQLVADIPAEIRPAAVLANRMASLNANTTASRDSAVTAKDTLDFINPYGDEVISTLMEENPDIHKKIGEPLKGSGTGEGGLELDGAARKVTGRIPLLPLKEQEKLYEQIAEEYSAYIERLNQLGENKLEAETLPLDAITHSKTQVFEGSGNAPFKRGAQAEDVEVKKLTKLYSQEQVMTTLRDNLKLSETADMSEIVSAGQSQANEKWAEIRDESDKYIDKELDGMSDADKIRGTRVRLEGLRNRLATAMRAAPIGAKVKISTAEYGATAGVVVNFRRKTTTSNPLALSNYEFTIYTADSMRQLKIPASKLFTQMNAPTGDNVGKIFTIGPTNHVVMPDGSQMDLMEAFDHGQITRTERRTIVTGNLLAGFAQFKTGRIINFTTKDGDIRQGILMPAKFDTAKALEDKPIEFANADQIMRFLDTGTRIVVDDSDTMRVTYRNGEFTFSVPASKSKGGAFFLNQGITEAAGRDFVKSGSSMLMRLSGTPAKAVLEEMQGQGVTFSTTTFKDAAREITGQKKAEAVAVDTDQEPGGLKSVLEKDRPAFDEWFGDSKVVDDEGAPLVVYHGAEGGADFDVFETPSFFSSNEETASTYGEGMEVYLSLQNPLIVNAKGRTYRSFVPFHYIEEAKAAGHDGVIVKNIRDDARMSGEVANTYIVFDPAQIKSATDNNGNFDPNEDSILKSIPDKVSPDERMTVEEMKDLPYVEIEDILDTAEMSRDGSLLKMNAASHELLRRSFEESRIQAAEAQGKTVKQSDYEDLFGGEFLSPAKVQETVEILRSGAAKAESYNYPDEQVQTFKDHADMLEAAAAEGQGTVVVFILDSKLPHELFHQADYIGAAEKTLLNRHTPEYKTKLDQHPIRQILWDKHYSKYNEYKRYTSQKALNATLRAEIPAFLLESSDAELAAMGITPEMQADYMLMWFEGYAAKNGIESLDHFDKEELDVQDFIAQVKEAYKQNEPTRKKGQNNNGGIERSGEASSDVAGNTSGQSGALAESPGIRLTAETHFGRRIEKREIEKELGFDKDTRLRSLPLTLRRAGIDALDAAYEVFHDPAAIEAAQALLDEHGMEGSIALLRNMPAKGLGAEHGILSFMLMKALQNHAASIRDTDPETARKHFELSLELAREHAVMATSLGQYTRVPSIIGPSVETLMYAIQGIIEARGTQWHHKTMTPEAWENIEAMGRRLETALTKVEDLRRQNKNKQAKIKRLEDEKEGKRRRRTSSGNANRKQLGDLVYADKKRMSSLADAKARRKAELAAEGGLKSVIPSNEELPPLSWIKSRLRNGMPKGFYREVLEAKIIGSVAKGTAGPSSDLDVAVIIQPVRGKTSLKVTENYHSRILHENWKPSWNGKRVDFQFFYPDDAELQEYPSIALKSVIPSDGDLDATPTLAESDPQKLSDFSEIGAEMLIDGLMGEEEYLPADFKAEMLAEYGSGIEPYFDEIYKAAWAKRTEWLNQVATEQTKERIENKYNEGEDLADWEVAELLGKEKLTAKRRRFIEKYHAMTVGAKKPKKNIDAYKAIITDLTQDKSDATAIAAISFAEGIGTAEIHQRFVDAGVTKAEDQRQALREGNVIWEKAKVEFTKQQEAVANEILAAQGELRTIDELQWIARNELQASQRVVADEIRRIKNGEGWYALSKLTNVLNASRTMMASMDFSGALRQGGFFTYSKPEMQGKAFANMFKSIGEKGFGRAIQDLEAGANFVLSQRMGIDYAVAGKTDEGSMMGEELFRGDETIENVPIIGKLVAEGVVKWSERTYTAFLDTQRYVMADLFAKELMAAGMTFRSHPEEFKKIGDFINIATGRGVMPSNKWAKLLMDLPLFAPRYTLSRFQLINITLNPVAYANMPPAARKIIAKQALRFYGTTMGILGLAATLGAAIGASVNWDPDDDDFGKISVGNTKYDIFVGMLPTAKLLIKIVHSAIRTKGGFDNRVSGEFGWDIWNGVTRFVRGKLSPAASLAVDVFSGKDYTGNKTELVAHPDWFGGYPLPGKAIYSRLIPLVFNDIVEAYKLDGVVGVARSTPLTMLGVGVSNYKPRAERPETEAEKLAAKMSIWNLPSGESKLTKEARELKSELVARSRRGEDVSAEVDAAVKAGLFGDYHKREILSAAKKTLLEDKAEGLGLDYLETLLRYANPDETAQIMPMINKKMKDADEKGELKADQRTGLEGKGASIVGFFPMPDVVKEQFDTLGLKIPDVGESMTLEKGGPKTKLEYERYDRYRREALQKIYADVEELTKDPEYQKESDDEKRRLVKKAINKGRNAERKETKAEMSGVN